MSACPCVCLCVSVCLCVCVCISVCWCGLSVGVSKKGVCRCAHIAARLCVSVPSCHHFSVSVSRCGPVRGCVHMFIVYVSLSLYTFGPASLRRCVSMPRCGCVCVCLCVGAFVSLCLDACVSLCVSVCTYISIAFYVNVSLDSCMFGLLCLCARSRVSCLCLHLRLNATVRSRVLGRVSVGGGGVVSVSVVLCTCRGVWSCVVCGAFVCAFVWFCAICLRGVASLCGVPACLRLGVSGLARSIGRMLVSVGARSARAVHSHVERFAATPHVEKPIRKTAAKSLPLFLENTKLFELIELRAFIRSLALPLALCMRWARGPTRSSSFCAVI